MVMGISPHTLITAITVATIATATTTAAATIATATTTAAATTVGAGAGADGARGVERLAVVKVATQHIVVEEEFS
jgi:hypothetical protein